MSKILLEKKRFEITLDRLCCEVIENHIDLSGVALIGLQPRGIYLAKALHQRLINKLNPKELPLGNLDITFYRDDFRRRELPLAPKDVDLDFTIEDQRVILIDDVLFTGRTVRSGLDALLDYGRPKKVEFLVLVDRKYARQLPIEPNYIGISVDTRASQKVQVDWKATEGINRVRLIDL